MATPFSKRLRRFRPLAFARAKFWALHAYAPAMRAHPLAAARFLLLDPETDNYTYDIDNTDELVRFLPSVLGVSSEQAAQYLAEIAGDETLRGALEARFASRPRRKRRALYGRRIGWYIVTRAEKPTLVVETGVHDGLGSSVFLRALERNAEEGHEGRLVGIDIDPQAGWLIPDWLRDSFTFVCADSLTALRSITSVDIFLHDSDHRAQYEAAEFSAVRSGLSSRAILLSDNAHATDVLRRFAEEQGWPYAYWHERPLRHFYPGGGIGIAGPGLRQDG
jgi:hypothetical protein